MTAETIPELRFKHTDLWKWTAAADARVIVHEGGTGSSKTYSLAQWHIVKSFHERDKLYTVARATLPALKRSALRDFRRVLAETGANEFFTENRQDLCFTNCLTGTKIEFVSFDLPQKARGPRRDRLWPNEANELSEETFRQLAMRTRLSITPDYNPSMVRHWLYDKVLTRKDAVHFKSTYKNNIFLSREEVREIEEDVPVYMEAGGDVVKDWDLTYTGSGHLIKGDPYRWGVFGLGQRGSPSEAVFPVIETGLMPEGVETVLGLDFGFNHPMVLMRCAHADGEFKALHFDELLHASYLTTEDLIGQLPGLGVSKEEPMYCDGSRPEVIEALRRAGYNAKGADKGAGSVYAGLTWMKGHRIMLTPRSEKSRWQFQDYRWKKHADGRVLDEPVKIGDDAPDAARYGAFTHWGARQNVWVW